MSSIASGQKDSSGKAQQTSSPADRRRAISTPFRELRRHLATLQRILDRDHTSRGSNPSMAAELSQSLRSLAKTARTSGLSTYCSVVLHVLEQLSAAKRTCYVPSYARDLLRDWVSLSWSYLLAPGNSWHAIELIGSMGNLRWERPVCRVQRDALLEGLQVEALQLAVLRNGILSSARHKSR